MIFHEIYSAYYNAVAKILTHLVSEGAEEKDLKKIVEKYAFEESALTILPSLKSGKWQLVGRDMTTPIVHEPTMPLTTLEKRWLKAISLDKRIRLFGITFGGLEDVEPLFTEADYCVYDKYSDGDPYDDEGYIERFKTILEAISKRLPLKVEMINRSGEVVFRRCIPTRLEYSEKDDKFRMYTSGSRFVYVMNLGRIIKCKIYQGDRFVPSVDKPPRLDTVTLDIKDERNALERVMLHFAHFEKQAECIGNRKYRLTVTYNIDDEPEMVIRILSFGPLVEVVKPEGFRNLIIEKLKKQQSCGPI